MKHARTKIFTINYDLCLEKAAANLQYMVLDGFSYSLPREFDISFYNYDWVRRDGSADLAGFIPNLVHLYKLHGSVDWEKTPTGVVKKPGVSRPLLLFVGGDHQELILEAPFLELLSQFHVALRQPKTTVLVVGFGFSNNQHLALPLPRPCGSMRICTWFVLPVISPSRTAPACAAWNNCSTPATLA